MKTAILFDCGGKLTAQLFASRANAATIKPVADETERLVVTITLADDFDPARDYVVRQVNKGSIENQLVAGTMPVWAGGELKAERVWIAGQTLTDAIAAPQGWQEIADFARRGWPVEVPNAD